MATDLQVTTNKLSNKETQLTVKVPVEKFKTKLKAVFAKLRKLPRLTVSVKVTSLCHTSALSTVLAFNKKLSTM